MTRNALAALLLVGCTACHGLETAPVPGTTAVGQEKITLFPRNCVIVLQAGTSDVKTNEMLAKAAQELGKHLRLITGMDIATIVDAGEIAGRYPFYIGFSLPGDKKPLLPEEARWVITREATYFYGDKNNGSRFAVYGFLEDELGVRWIEPGDRGIAYTKQFPIRLRTGAYSWAPELQFRGIRPGVSTIKDASGSAAGPEAIQEFQVSAEVHNKYVDDVMEWGKRQRMGSHSAIAYGHAFTSWWQQYGKTHPEYFALNKYGIRAPVIDTPQGWQTMKLCPSNPSVSDQIIENWLANSKKRPHGINVCENDSGPNDFCTCAGCTALDVKIKGKEGLFGRHLTDRYIFLCNTVARKAREHDPSVAVATYAYNETEQPPRQQVLEPNVVVGFVPITIAIEQ